jgi:hypothetical protein
MIAIRLKLHSAGGVILGQCAPFTCGIGQISNAYVCCRIATIAAAADVPEAHEVGVQ